MKWEVRSEQLLLEKVVDTINALGQKHWEPMWMEHMPYGEPRLYVILRRPIGGPNLAVKVTQTELERDIAIRALKAIRKRTERATRLTAPDTVRVAEVAIQALESIELSQKHFRDVEHWLRQQEEF